MLAIQELQTGVDHRWHAGSGERSSLTIKFVNILFPLSPAASRSRQDHGPPALSAPGGQDGVSWPLDTRRKDMIMYFVHSIHVDY